MHSYLSPLKKILSEVEVENCFPGIAKIFVLHSEFVKKLTGALALQNVRDRRLQFAKVFVTLSGQVEEVYGSYINGFERSQKILQTVVAKNQAAKYAIDSVKSDVFSGMQYLEQLWIAPTQRLARFLLFLSFFFFFFLFVCRYPLLLGEIMKCSSEVHFDHEDLSQALESLKAAAAKINQNKQQAVGASRKQFLQSHASKVRFLLLLLLLPFSFFFFCR